MESVEFIQHIMVLDIKFDSFFLDFIPDLTGAVTVSNNMSSLVSLLSFELHEDVTSKAYFHCFPTIREMLSTEARKPTRLKEG